MVATVVALGVYGANEALSGLKPFWLGIQGPRASRLPLATFLAPLRGSEPRTNRMLRDSAMERYGGSESTTNCVGGILRCRLSEVTLVGRGVRESRFEHSVNRRSMK